MTVMGMSDARQDVETIRHALLLRRYVHGSPVAIDTEPLRALDRLAAASALDPRDAARDALIWLDIYLEADGRSDPLPHTTARKKIAAALAALDARAGGQERERGDLYDFVTAQLEHEFDAAGYDGDTTTLEALERIKAAVVEWRDGAGGRG